MLPPRVSKESYNTPKESYNTRYTRQQRPTLRDKRDLNTFQKRSCAFRSNLPSHVAATRVSSAHVRACGERELHHRGPSSYRSRPHASCRSSRVSIQYSVMLIRGNGVTLRTQKVIQGGDNGHVGRPCEVSPAPPCPELFCELRGLCRHSYFGPRTCGRSK